MISVPNYDVIIPIGSDLSLSREINSASYNRGEQRGFIYAYRQAVITLPFTPVCPEWVELFDEHGLVVINPRVRSSRGGEERAVYNIVGNTLTFTNTTSGHFTVVCDTTPNVEQGSTLIPIKNSQGFMVARASLYVEPVIVSEPQHGYTRISTDRKSMVYMPQKDFYGTDGFSYCLINNHGQYSKNYCVDITIPQPSLLGP